MKLAMYRFLGVLAACTMTLTLAASTTYTYTGNAFQAVFGGSYTTSDFVSGFFTVASPLADNLVFSNQNVTPISYSFTDGVQTFDSTSPPTNVTFDIGTDASGTITQWDINLGTGPPLDDSVSTNSSSGDAGQMLSAGAFGDNLGNPGTFVMSGGSGSPTPEPANLGLFGLGLVAIGIIRRKVRMERPLREPFPPE